MELEGPGEYGKVLTARGKTYSLNLDGEEEIVEDSDDDEEL